MIYISHRGNINGRYFDRENRSDYINNALNEGFDVEIDVWFTDNQWWLGHDEPTYKTGTSIFKNPKIWAHVKNPEALLKIQEVDVDSIIYNKQSVHYFWHDGDDYAITSKGYVWCHKDAITLPNSIAVLPEAEYGGFETDLSHCRGICSDTILYYKRKYG